MSTRTYTLFILVNAVVLSAFATESVFWDDAADLLVTNENDVNYLLLHEDPRVNIMIEMIGANDEQQFLIAQRYRKGSATTYNMAFNIYDGTSWNTIYLESYEHDDNFNITSNDYVADNYTLLSDSSNNGHLLKCYEGSVDYYFLNDIINDWIDVGSYSIENYVRHFCQAMSAAISENDTLYVSFQVHESLYNNHRCGYFYNDAYGGIAWNPIWSEFKTITDMSNWGPMYHDMDCIEDDVLHYYWEAASPTDDKSLITRPEVGIYNGSTFYDTYTLCPKRPIAPSDLGWQLRRYYDTITGRAAVCSGSTTQQKAINQYFVMFPSFCGNNQVAPLFFLYDSEGNPKIQLVFGNISDFQHGYTCDLAIDSTGIVHLAGSIGGNIYYQTYNPNIGTLSSEELVYENEPDAILSEIFVDTNDVPHIIYRSSGDYIMKSYHEARNPIICTNVGFNDISLPDSPIGDVTISNPYPNPAQEFLTFDITSFVYNPYTIEIYDIAGRLIDEVEYSGIYGQTTLLYNVSSLKSGIYLYKIGTVGYTKNGRFLVH